MKQSPANFNEEYKYSKNKLSKVFVKMIKDGNKINLDEYRKLTRQQEMFINYQHVEYK